MKSYIFQNNLSLSKLFESYPKSYNMKIKRRLDHFVAKTMLIFVLSMSNIATFKIMHLKLNHFQRDILF